MSLTPGKRINTEFKQSVNCLSSKLLEHQKLLHLSAETKH
ncbi:hypothetical protein BSMD_034200 [Bacillus subtilis Miyagi-4]|nr:hypothetical protein BSMD_034200 [Bacillus subtilis Miyagi-4]